MASEPDSIDDTPSTRAPWHLWAVGVAALLWNAIGALDYVMTRSRNDAYLNVAMPGIDPATVYSYIEAMPLLAQIGWGFGVWGAVAGTLLLLARSRFAVPAYLVSLIGAILSFTVQFTGDPAPAGMDSKVMPIVITVIALALLLYARAMRGKGVLR